MQRARFVFCLLKEFRSRGHKIPPLEFVFLLQAPSNTEARSIKRARLQTELLKNFFYCITEVIFDYSQKQNTCRAILLGSSDVKFCHFCFQHPSQKNAMFQMVCGIMNGATTEGLSRARLLVSFCSYCSTWSHM